MAMAMADDDFEGSMAELALLENPVIALPGDNGIAAGRRRLSWCRRSCSLIVIVQVVTMLAVVTQMIVVIGVIGWLIAHREAFIEGYQGVIAVVDQISHLLDELRAESNVIPAIVEDMLQQLQQINQALRRIDQSA